MFRGKTALVTGAASGIGHATAKRLAAEGARLFLVDRDRETLGLVAEKLRESGASVSELEADVSERARMQEVAAAIHKEVEALDLLVNNAGTLVTGGFDDSSLEEWERVIRVNLLGVVYSTKLFVPSMKKRGSGAIVNVASASGLVGFPTITAYATTKFAVVGLTLSMRGELAGTGVSVSAVCPGLVKTRIMETSGLPEKEQSEIRELLERHGAEPDAIARAILRAAKKDSGVVPVGWQAHMLNFAGKAARNSLPKLIARLGDTKTFKTRVD